jgi:NAD(P)-dependent dehydrogenase (short-subunit alcohol dehydrogenase family)
MTLGSPAERTAGRPPPVALVTGAAHGIGAAIARRLGRDGWRLALTAETDPHDTLAALRHDGVDADAHPADLRAPAEVEQVADWAAERFGPVTGLVNNAGRTLDRRLEHCSVDDFDDVVALNLRAPWLLVRHLAPGMAAAGGGAVVNVGSVHRRRTLPGFSAYAASKGGLRALTSQLAVELAPAGIRVNCVEPGLVLVPRMLDAPWLEAAAARSPSGRLTTPEEVATAVAWLLDGADVPVTGAAVPLDGGQSCAL